MQRTNITEKKKKKVACESICSQWLSKSFVQILVPKMFPLFYTLTKWVYKQ